VNEDPVPGDGRLILQKTQINFATDADHVNHSGLRLVREKLDDLSRYG
jgi:hypothetical protein